jgi:predicted alpha/beta superfamily hydrolase
MLRLHEVPSLYLGAPRRITVWLPPGSRRRVTPGLPVLYLNDGQNLFDPARAFAGATWRVADTADWLVKRRRIPPMLIVGIDHGVERRGREYLPVEDDRNPATARPLGREYAAFVTRELLPFVRREYATARGAAGAGFGGSSYGAVAALHTALVAPGVFGRLLLESPSLYVGNRHLLRLARRATRWPSKIYLGVGTAEAGSDERNRETVDHVIALGAHLHRAGLAGRRLAVVVEPGATHSEGAWAARLPGALEFLYGRA